jgi:hypothetical protein
VSMEYCSKRSVMRMAETYIVYVSPIHIEQSIRHTHIVLVILSYSLHSPSYSHNKTNLNPSGMTTAMEKGQPSRTGTFPHVLNWICCFI